MRRVKYWLIMGLALAFAGNMTVPAVATLISADLVSGIGASKRPVAGKLLALDNHAKFPNSVLRTGHRGGIDSDKLDGLHGPSYSKRDHNHDSRYVDSAGDTMTGTITAPDFAYYPAKIGRLRIPAAAFVGETGAATHANNGRLAGASDAGNIYAPITIPEGSQLVQLKLHYYDAADPANVTLNLMRGPVNGVGATTALSSASSTGSTGYGTVEDNSVYGIQLDFTTSFYWLRVQGTGTDAAVEGVEVLYRYSSPGS